MDGVDDEDRAVSMQWRQVLPIVAVAVVAAGLGYAIGFARGAADLDGGSSPTTSMVEPVPGGGDGTLPVAPTTDPVLPPDPTTTVELDEAIPTEVDGAAIVAAGSWTVTDGSARPAEATGWPSDADLPPPPAEATRLRIDAASPVAVITARFATVTASSGLALALAGDDAWQLAVAPDLGGLRLYQVTEGVPEQRGTVLTPIADGATLGLFLRDGRIGVLVDGEQRAVEGFFGVELDLDANGATAGAGAVVAGSGTPAVTQLAFG